MPRNLHKPEEIVAKRRQVHVLISQGRIVVVTSGLPLRRSTPVRASSILFTPVHKPPLAPFHAFS